MNVPENLPDSPSDFLIYQSEDGRTRVEARMVNETVWVSLGQMAALFQRDKSVISRHISSIYKEGELTPQATVAKYATVQTEGARPVTRNIDFYNLDMVLAVGYRVKSPRGVQFRTWATQRLRDYIVKGFALDDERLKQAGGGGYFEELLARIRDIRASEKVFWRKVLDIYATSVDYDPSDDQSRAFFATIQNKMHWAAHGHTAAEIVNERADAAQPNMGLTSWTGVKPRQADAEVAKNYLKSDELDALNRIVTAYLEFAELQALNRRPMHMADWIVKLDDFLKLSGREILTHAGVISHEQALAKARLEYDKYRAAHLDDPSPVEKHFIEAVAEAKRLEAVRRGKTRRRS